MVNTSTTDKKGEFEFTDLTRGDQTLELELAGVPDAKKKMAVKADPAATAEFIIERIADSLPKTIVTDEDPRIFLEVISGGAPVQNGGGVRRDLSLKVMIRYLNCRIKKLVFGPVLPSEGRLASALGMNDIKDIGSFPPTPSEDQVWGEIEGKEIAGGTLEKGEYALFVHVEPANEGTIKDPIYFRFQLNDDGRKGIPIYNIITIDPSEVTKSASADIRFELDTEIGQPWVEHISDQMHIVDSHDSKTEVKILKKAAQGKVLLVTLDLSPIVPGHHYQVRMDILDAGNIIGRIISEKTITIVNDSSTTAAPLPAIRTDDPVIPEPHKRAKKTKGGSQDPRTIMEPKDVNTARLLLTYVKTGQMPPTQEFQAYTTLTQVQFQQVKYLVDTYKPAIPEEHHPLIVLTPFFNAEEREFLMKEVPEKVVVFLVAFLGRLDSVGDGPAAAGLGMTYYLVFTAYYSEPRMRENVYQQILSKAQQFYSDPNQGMLALRNLSLIEHKPQQMEFLTLRKIYDGVEEQKARTQGMLSFLNNDEQQETIALEQVNGRYVHPSAQKLQENRQHDKAFGFTKDFEELEKTIEEMKRELKKKSKGTLEKMKRSLDLFRNYNVKETQLILDELDTWSRSPGISETLRGFDKVFKGQSHGYGFVEFIRMKTDENIHAIVPLQQRFIQADELLDRINSEIMRIDAVHPHNKEEADRESDRLLKELSRIESDIKSHSGEFERHRPKIESFTQNVIQNDSQVQEAIDIFLEYLSNNRLITEKERERLGVSTKRIAPTNGMLSGIRNAISKPQ